MIKCQGYNIIIFLLCCLFGASQLDAEITSTNINGFEVYYIVGQNLDHTCYIGHESIITNLSHVSNHYLTTFEKRKIGWTEYESERSYAYDCIISHDKRFILHGRFSGVYFYLVIYDIKRKKYSLIGKKIVKGSWRPDGLGIIFNSDHIEVANNPMTIMSPSRTALPSERGRTYSLELPQNWQRQIKWMKLEELLRKIYDEDKEMIEYIHNSW